MNRDTKSVVIQLNLWHPDAQLVFRGAIQSVRSSWNPCTPATPVLSSQARREYKKAYTRVWASRFAGRISSVGSAVSAES